VNPILKNYLKQLAQSVLVVRERLAGGDPYHSLHHICRPIASLQFAENGSRLTAKDSVKILPYTVVNNQNANVRVQEGPHTSFWYTGNARPVPEARVEMEFYPSRFSP